MCVLLINKHKYTFQYKALYNTKVYSIVRLANVKVFPRHWMYEIDKSCKNENCISLLQCQL